jgi:predicted  nucleic acid-binding Zn-ribbon protein
MQVKRGTSEVGTGVVSLMGQFSMLAQKEITKIKHESEKKETELDEVRRHIQELEHKNALQEKDLQIKELELQVSRQKEESTNNISDPDDYDLYTGEDSDDDHDFTHFEDY